MYENVYGSTIRERKIKKKKFLQWSAHAPINIPEYKFRKKKRELFMFYGTVMMMVRPTIFQIKLKCKATGYGY